MEDEGGMAPSRVNFAFVTVTSSAPELDAESRGLIKKNVMKDIGFSRRRFRPKAAHNARRLGELSNFKSSSRTSLKTAHVSNFADNEAVTKATDEIEFLLRAIIRSSNPFNAVASGYVDPFASLPIQGDVEVDTLITHIHDDTHASFKLFREYWFPIAVQDPAALHCTLAQAAQHLMTFYPQHSKERAHQRKQYVSHYAAAISSVKDRVGDPAQNTTDDMIAAIIMLACDHASSNAAKNYLQHMDGLDKIIRLRGGVETLELNRSLRLLLFWIDTIGASVLNLSPRFPLPAQYLPGYDEAFRAQVRPRLPNSISEEWAATFQSHIELISIFDDLCALTVMVEKEALQEQAAQEPRFTGFYILPLVHRLFTLQSEKRWSYQETMVFEACKLSAFLYLQNLRHFVARRYPCLKSPFFESREESVVTSASSCAKRLRSIMLGHGVIWTVLQPLKCWALTIGAHPSNMMPYRPDDVADLLILAASPSYYYWCRSMGPLMSNSWTHSLADPS